MGVHKLLWNKTGISHSKSLKTSALIEHKINMDSVCTIVYHCTIMLDKNAQIKLVFICTCNRDELCAITNVIILFFCATTQEIAASTVLSAC